MAQLLEDSLFCEEFIQQCPAAVEVLNLVAQECSAGECQMSADAMSCGMMCVPTGHIRWTPKTVSGLPSSPASQKSSTLQWAPAHAWVFSYFLFYIYINMKSLWWFPQDSLHLRITEFLFWFALYFVFFFLSSLCRLGRSGTFFIN